MFRLKKTVKKRIKIYAFKKFYSTSETTDVLKIIYFKIRNKKIRFHCVVLLGEEKTEAFGFKTLKLNLFYHETLSSLHLPPYFLLSLIYIV